MFQISIETCFTTQDKNGVENFLSEIASQF